MVFLSMLYSKAYSSHTFPNSISTGFRLSISSGVAEKEISSFSIFSIEKGMSVDGVKYCCKKVG